MLEKHISTAVWGAQHPNAGQNIPQLVPRWRAIMRSRLKYDKEQFPFHQILTMASWNQKPCYQWAMLTPQLWAFCTLFLMTVKCKNLSVLIWSRNNIQIKMIWKRCSNVSDYLSKFSSVTFKHLFFYGGKTVLSWIFLLKMWL